MALRPKALVYPLLDYFFKTLAGAVFWPFYTRGVRLTIVAARARVCVCVCVSACLLSVKSHLILLSIIIAFQ